MSTSSFMSYYYLEFCDRASISLGLNTQHGHWVCWMSTGRKENTHINTSKWSNPQLSRSVIFPPHSPLHPRNCRRDYHLLGIDPRVFYANLDLISFSLASEHFLFFILLSLFVGIVCKTPGLSSGFFQL